MRHNEELLNAELADSLPWDTSDLPMDNAHTKASKQASNAIIIIPSNIIIIPSTNITTDLSY